MAVTVLIPTPLRPFVGGKDLLVFEAGSVGELLRQLTSQHVELRKHLFADDGRLRSFVNVYVNDRDYPPAGSRRRACRGRTSPSSPASQEGRRRQ